MKRLIIILLSVCLLFLISCSSPKVKTIINTNITNAISDFTIEDNVVIKFNNFEAKTAIIPEGVVEIGNSAFSLCRNLEEVIIPKTCTVISIQAFAYCKNLKSVVLTDSITHIDKNVFEWCDKLTLYGTKDSLANKYADNNGIKFIAQ